MREKTCLIIAEKDLLSFIKGEDILCTAVFNDGSIEHRYKFIHGNFASLTRNENWDYFLENKLKSDGSITRHKIIIIKEKNSCR